MNLTFAKILCLFLSMSLFISCKKTDVSLLPNKIEDNTSSPVSGAIINIAQPLNKVYFLGHKGAGSNNYNEINMEQSIASFKEAINVLDGVEIDLQMSLDGTLWLFHDIDIVGTTCTVLPFNSIINMHDKEIAALKLCSRTKHDRVYKWSELLDLWNATKNGFYISIEVKEGFTNSLYKKAGGQNFYTSKIAEKLAASITHLNHPAEQFITESSDANFFKAFKKYPNVSRVKSSCFAFEPFDKIVQNALAMHIDGVSVEFSDPTMTASKIKEAQKRGLIVQLWTPYTNAEITTAYKLSPNFIQTDRTNCKKALHL